MKHIQYAVALLVAMLTFLGCAQKNTATHGDHPHNEHLLITEYNASYELFAEVRPFVVGRTSNVLAHFTHLENFKPLRSGTVTTSVIVGTDGIRQSLPTPTKPGIYYFELTPNTAGKGKLIFDIKSEEGSASFEIPITVYTDAHEADHIAADLAVESSNGANFTKEQSWKIGYATQTAQKIVMGEMIRATAQILPTQNDIVQIVAKTDGVVNFLSDNILEGTKVEASSPLFSIVSSSMSGDNMGVQYNQAKVAYEKAQATLQRKEALAKEHIISQAELLEAKSQFLQAEISFKNLRNNFSENGQMVAATRQGYLTEVLVQNGQFVTAGTPLAVIAKNKELLVRADVAPKYFSLLQNITTATFKLLNNSEVYTLEELEGKVISYSKSIDASNPLLSVLFQIENSRNFLPGSFVEMNIKTAGAESFITIPKTALIEEMGSYFVYKQLTPELFEKTEVSIGENDGINVAILTGIAEGDRVVSKGAILVKLAQAAGAIDPHSGHVH